MFRKGLILSIALIMSQFVSAGSREINFDSSESVQMGAPLVEVAADIPFVHLPPRPVVEVYGETDGGKIVRLSPVGKTKDRDFDGKHYAWVPGLKSAIFNMTCIGDGNDYVWQLRLMKPINLPQCAGHDHATGGNLPVGTTYYPAPDLQAGAAYYINGQPWTPQINYQGEVLTGVLGPKSVVKISIPDPKYSTSIALPLQYSGACNGGETRYMDIMVPDLVALPASGTTYVLTGEVQSVHTQNHFGTVETIEALKRLAAKWRVTHPNSNKIVFNDISLPWGGAFELKGNWDANASHYDHSFGVAADVSKQCVKKSDRSDLIKLMGAFGFTVLSEGDPAHTISSVLPSKSQAHYHIEYMSEIDRLVDVVIPPNNIKFPIETNGMMKGVVPNEQEQYDNGRSISVTRNMPNCQEYMEYVNNCQNPVEGSNNDKYCHCIGLFSGLNSTPENLNNEPKGYKGCP